MIDATKFAMKRGRYRIGVFERSTVVAAELRRIADRMEAGEINIQKVQTGQQAADHEWVSCCLYIEFDEKEPLPDRSAPEPIIKLE